MRDCRPDDQKNVRSPPQGHQSFNATLRLWLPFAQMQASVIARYH